MTNNQGDADLEAWLDVALPRIYRLSFALTRDRQAAEDLSQEALAQSSTSGARCPEPRTRRHYALPAIEPQPEALGISGVYPPFADADAELTTLPVFNAQQTDNGPVATGVLSVRKVEYLDHSGARPDGTTPSTSLTVSSYPDGQKVFDAIVANTGPGRWRGPVRREDWAGHDGSATFLAVQSGGEFPTQVAVRFEGDVLISVVTTAETQDRARDIATKLADGAAKNLASFGRGPDGRPGNGK